MFEMLSTVYPEVDWLPWRFSRAPKTSKLKENPKVVSLTVDYIEAQLKLRNIDEWYRVSNPQLDQLGVLNWTRKLGGLCALLKAARPGVSWEDDKFASITK
jgi:hypothetical protein